MSVDFVVDRSERCVVCVHSIVRFAQHSNDGCKQLSTNSSTSDDDKVPTIRIKSMGKRMVFSIADFV